MEAIRKGSRDRYLAAYIMAVFIEPRREMIIKPGSMAPWRSPSPNPCNILASLASSLEQYNLFKQNIIIIWVIRTIKLNPSSKKPSN